MPRETRQGERRVAIVPEVAGRLSGSGVDVVLQAGAGASAYFPDAAYRDKGAEVVDGLEGVLAGAEVTATVNAPAPEVVDPLLGALQRARRLGQS